MARREPLSNLHAGKQSRSQPRQTCQWHRANTTRCHSVPQCGSLASTVSSPSSARMLSHASRAFPPKCGLPASAASKVLHSRQNERSPQPNPSDLHTQSPACSIRIPAAEPKNAARRHGAHAHIQPPSQWWLGGIRHPMHQPPSARRATGRRAMLGSAAAQLPTVCHLRVAECGGRRIGRRPLTPQSPSATK